jgi:RimJ/RimL family protein N-acetyltransferase
MFIDYLGIRFHVLQENTIEVLRNWRNARHVRSFMHDRRYVSTQDQANWFQRVNNPHYLYLLIEDCGSLIGSISLKEIDYSQRRGEIGFLIGHPSYLESKIAAISQIAAVDIAYYVYGLDTIHGHVLKSNRRAISGYLELGATVNEAGIHSVTVEMCEAEYVKRRMSLLKAIKILSPRTDLRFHVFDAGSIITDTMSMREGLLRQIVSASNNPSKINDFVIHSST